MYHNMYDGRNFINNNKINNLINKIMVPNVFKTFFRGTIQRGEAAIDANYDNWTLKVISI